MVKKIPKKIEKKVSRFISSLKEDEFDFEKVFKNEIVRE